VLEEIEMKKKLLLVTIFGLLLVLLMGCSGDPEVETPEASGPVSSEETQEDSEEQTAETEEPVSEEPEIEEPVSEEPEQEPLKVVSLVQPLDNPRVVNNVRFQKAVAEALGIELTVITDEGTEDSNIAAMERAIAMNPDAILFDPITTPAGVRDAALLEENQIPGCTQDRLVLVDINDYTGDYLICAATIDTKMWGYNMMNALISQGATKIAAIMDPKGVLTVEQAWEGALQIVEENPGVEILQESWQQKGREQGMETMERYLATYGSGEIDGVYVFGSTTGLGALYAIEQADRADEVMVSTCDIDEDVAQLIKEGRLGSSAGAHWMLGGFGLIMLHDYMHGFEPIERQPAFPLIVVTQSNVDKYVEAFLNGLPYTEEEIRQLSKVYNPDANVVDELENLYLTWDD